MKRHEQLLLENKAWSQERTEADPTYFQRLVQGQEPDFLWIGCSDSRVAAEEITQAQPGEIFVHRNIANLVLEEDANLLGGIQFAVEVLKVKHIIICGHYACGGVKASMGPKLEQGSVETWLTSLRRIYIRHQAEIDALENETLRVNRLVELNVCAQLRNLARLPVIQKAWRERGVPLLHGWVYDIGNGLIKSELELDANSDLGEIAA